MAWVGDELWFVNTRFSCLCTLNGIHSFVPRWRPPFVTALAPEDRCHLNGLGLAPDANGQLVPTLCHGLGRHPDTPPGLARPQEGRRHPRGSAQRHSRRQRSVDAALAALGARAVVAAGVGHWRL